MADPPVKHNAGFWVVANFVEGLLNAAVNASAVSWILKSGQGARFPSSFPYPLVGRSTREIVKCTGRVDDTLTVVRSQEGTSAPSNTPKNEVIELLVTAQQYTELFEKGKNIERVFGAMLGLGPTDIIIVDTGDSGTNMFFTQEQGAPDLTLLVAPGKGVINLEPIEVRSAEDTTAIVAPLSDPPNDNRIDLLEYILGTGLNIVTGTPGNTPSAPSATANAIPLYEVGKVGNYITPSTTTLVNAMLTDLRGAAIG